ncbi:polysaccharide biosynthesis/export family protein [Primorskyibacter sp. S187A]|uniref:polysaccharide biosynthesis/export family protein n=1 Tax=Primorskyibacter sp. S187A TaxID=3415130 RepID=UPI003C7C97A5
MTRDIVPDLAAWPATGWHGHYHWIESSHGPASNTLQAGDLVNLRIWDNQVNSLLTGPNTNMVSIDGITVSPSGTIFVPYVDDVVVRGMTPDRARRKIQNELAPIAPDAQVQLTQVQGASNSVSVVAGVGAPGSFPLPNRNTTILNVLALAGGINDDLRNPIVSLVRGSKTYTIPAADLFASADKNTRVRGGDKILVEEDDRSFTALGASGIENIIYFPKEQVHAIEALSLMGGINDNRADPKGVLVLREYSVPALNTNAMGPTNQQVVFVMDLTSAEGLFAARKFQIHPGDTVLATESPVTVVSTIFRIIGQAFGLSTQASAVVR